MDEKKNELWKSLPFEDWKTYQASSEGKIKSKTYRIIALMKNKNSGYIVYLSHKGKQKAFAVDFLIASTFLPNPDKYTSVLHKDGDRFNNNIENLDWKRTHHRGVVYNKVHKLYRAIFRYENKKYDMGYFKTEPEASQAYQNKIAEVLNGN